MKNLPCNKNQAYLITDRLMQKYLSRADVEEGYLIYNQKYTCYTDARYFSAAKLKLEEVGVCAELFTGLEDIKSFLLSNGITELFIDFDNTTVTEYNSLKDFNIEISDCSKTLKEIRAIKSEEELSYIKMSCEIAQKAYYMAIKEVKKGITERHLKDRIESLILSLGAEGTSFETIVAFGSNAAVPHHQTGDTVLLDDMVILIDMGCKYKGYCSDLTRTAFFGKPDKRFIDCYNAVLEANVKAEDKITSNTLTDEADGFAREVLKANDLEQYFTHSLGHGIGLLVHEYPTLLKKRSDRIANGTVFTIEPGVYIEGEFGIRIEDTVVLKNDKVERLFTDKKDLLIL